MNPHDQANLAFLLSADPKTIKEWYSKTTADDRKYASQLLSEYAKQLALVSEDAHLNRIEMMLEDMDGDYKSAKRVLAKFL